MAFDLTGKSAIVTGATKGLGHGMAIALANAGANVVIVSRNQGDCDRVAADIAAASGVKTLACACDVSKPDSIKKLVDATVEKFGVIDILVNNAGVAVTKNAEDLTEEDWDYVVDINLKGVFMLSQAVGRVMIAQKHGRIINIASMFGLVGDKRILPYLASKGGVIQLTKGLALEWAKYNILVNAVAPGYIMTSINEKEFQDEKISSYIKGKTPLRRIGVPEEIAGMIVYLASDEASFCTGSVFTVDGGWGAQ
jgi:NAD(P)-dependent dehydrogenase (short-subunit alcohol dehydrogenase family)